MTDKFHIDVDYYRLPRRAGRQESDFLRASLHWDLPVHRAALVLVDMWSEHYVSSHLQRGQQITEQRIVPLLETFRNAGATVVHAPSPDCAPRYGHLLTEAADPPDSMQPESLQRDWPPASFRSKSGEFAAFARPADPQDDEFNRIIAERSIMAEVEPQQGDCVVFTGEQLHAVLRDRGVTTLFYVGFAANMCVPNRDYGMRAMRGRGYDVVLVRDCTSAIEVADSVAELGLTAAAVRDVETVIGYSIESASLRQGAPSRGSGR